MTTPCPAKNLRSDGTGEDQGSRQAAGKMAAAAVVVKAAIANLTGVIGMAGPHDMAQLIVIPRVLIAVADHGT
mgnify:CR=1 FL=1